jgi:hypothetical protein
MAQWDGRGLPPVARARVARVAGGGARTSLLDVNGAAGVEASGFDIVAETLGTAVIQISWTGFQGCGTVGLGGARGLAGTMAPRWVGCEPYVDAVRGGWAAALSRMLAEASAVGADGVVGVRLSDKRLDETKREFVALGTAVRSRGSSWRSPPASAATRR